MLKGYSIIEDVASDCLLHHYTAAHVYHVEVHPM